MKERYKQVQSVSGSCMLIKRSVIDRIGLLDERFFAYYEDSDFCLRATRAGFNVVASRNARIRHKMKNTLGSRTPQAYYIYVRNQPLFMIKNCPWIFWPDYFAMYLLKALARIAYFSVTGRPDIAGAVKNGLVDAFSRNFGKGRVFG
ncbi:MAG: glycosyltransferase [Candidatus Omnitrophica bacterium]|nr:glycosyltransferase [Candidatus Omnitrophota bacterium]